MNGVPPAEAFEPRPDEPLGESRTRRRIRIAVTLLVVTALVVLAAVEGSGFVIRRNAVQIAPSPTTAPSVPVWRLAVVDAAAALSITDGRGGPLVPLSAPGTRFQFPAWSPDGSRLAAAGEGATGSSIHVFAVGPARPAGGSDEPVVNPVVVYESRDAPAFYLYWTPDGQRVTFLTTEPEPAGLALRMVPADGIGAATIVRQGAPMYWDFVDDSRLFVHSGTGGSGGFLGEVRVDGAPFEGTERSAGVFRSPSVSIDDRFVAYLAPGDGAVGEVVRESRDGSGTTRIRVFGAAAMSFSPAADQLAFLAPDQPTSSPLPLPVGPLRLLDPDAAEARTLMGGSVVAFFWSPTGEQIAVLRLEERDDPVVEAGLDGGVVLARAPLRAAETAAGLALRLSFVMVADGTVRTERVVRVSDLFVNQVLPYFDQYALSHRFWSPDGAAIALPVVGDGDVTEVLVIPADGSQPVVAADAEIGFWSP